MSDLALDMDDLQTAWVDFMCDHSNRSLSYEEAVEAFAAIIAAHDAEVRADEREKAVSEVQAIMDGIDERLLLVPTFANQDSEAMVVRGALRDRLERWAARGDGAE